MVDVLRSLCKAGLPEGNIFDYTSKKLLAFEVKRNTQLKKESIIKGYQTIGKKIEPKRKPLPPIKYWTKDEKTGKYVLAYYKKNGVTGKSFVFLF